MYTDGQPPVGEVLGNINTQPDLFVNEANPDSVDAVTYPESDEAPVISSPLENGSGATDHQNELALMEQDAVGAHSEASEAFRVTARLAAPLAANGELGLRRLIYREDDPETGCRIYTPAVSR